MLTKCGKSGVSPFRCSHLPFRSDMVIEKIVLVDYKQVNSASTCWLHSCWSLGLFSGGQAVLLYQSSRSSIVWPSSMIVEKLLNW